MWLTDDEMNQVIKFIYAEMQGESTDKLSLPPCIALQEQYARMARIAFEAYHDKNKEEGHKAGLLASFFAHLVNEACECELKKTTIDMGSYRAS